MMRKKKKNDKEMRATKQGKIMRRLWRNYRDKDGINICKKVEEGTRH